MSTSLEINGVREARERYVSSAVATPPIVVVAADGARITAEET
jgi:hypothetical protein